MAKRVIDTYEFTDEDRRRGGEANHRRLLAMSPEERKAYFATMLAKRRARQAARNGETSDAPGGAE